MSGIDMNSIVGIMFVLARMSGCIYLNPIFGRRNIPAIAKTAIVVVLTLLLYSYTPLENIQVGSIIEFMVLILKEFLVGFGLGFIISLFTTILVVGGEMIDFQIGLSMAKVFDSQSNTSIALSSTFFNIIFMFLFFIGDGHLSIIRFFLDSSKIVPYGEVIFGQNIAMYMLDLFCDTSVMAMQFCMPVVAVGFLLEIGVGILMKIIPQINVFVINIQMKIFVGLICILIFYGPFVSFLQKMIELMFDALKASLPLMK